MEKATMYLLGLPVSRHTDRFKGHGYIPGHRAHVAGTVCIGNATMSIVEVIDLQGIDRFQEISRITGTSMMVSAPYTVEAVGVQDIDKSRVSQIQVNLMDMSTCMIEATVFRGNVVNADLKCLIQASANQSKP